MESAEASGPGLEPGAVVGGKYTVVRRLGEGGMGAVYEAVQSDLGRRVALKTLHQHLAQNATIVARFRREAEAAAALGHPNIVQVTDFGFRAGEGAYLVMDYLQGASLAATLAREGPLEPGRACFIARQVLAALEAAHAAGIVHRDLKPDNVYLTEVAGVGDVVKLLDFGIAKLSEGEESGAPRLTSTGAVLGTPAYMSPEQARGRAVDHRTDLYAVGVLLYECLSGRLPFAAENYNALLFAILEDTPAPLSALRPGLPLGLEALVARAMARDPAQRFASATELRAALEPYAAAPGARASSPQGGLGYAPAGGASFATGAGAGLLATAPAAGAPLGLASTMAAAMPVTRAGELGAAPAGPLAMPAGAPGPRASEPSPVRWIVAGVAGLALLGGAAVLGREVLGVRRGGGARAALARLEAERAQGAARMALNEAHEARIAAVSAGGTRVQLDLPGAVAAPSALAPEPDKVGASAALGTSGVTPAALSVGAVVPSALAPAVAPASPRPAPARRYEARLSGGILGRYRTPGLREALAQRMPAVNRCVNAAGERQPEWFMDFAVELGDDAHITQVNPRGDATNARPALARCVRSALLGARVGDPTDTRSMALSFSIRWPERY